MWVMDSGLGGLSVVRALRAARPGLPMVYLADTAGFPYGNRDPNALVERAAILIKCLASQIEASTIVLACNTLSTLCLAPLRQALPYHFVGTVPAIKTAAQSTQSKRFTLLATPNTTHSPYTDTLIQEFARDRIVDRVPAPNLARYAEQLLLGDAITPEQLRTELAPAFQDGAMGRTDCIVLGCTHYPLILDALKAAAPWDVRWIDSGEAIARRALALAGSNPANRSIAYVTADADVSRYTDIFHREGFDEVRLLTSPSGEVCEPSRTG